MAQVDRDTREAYRAAWEAWRKQLDHLHSVLLEGVSITPPQMKGLLNREARAKEAYERARDQLLGLEESEALPTADGRNPFR